MGTILKLILAIVIIMILFPNSSKASLPDNSAMFFPALDINLMGDEDIVRLFKKSKFTKEQHEDYLFFPRKNWKPNNEIINEKIEMSKIGYYYGVDEKYIYNKLAHECNLIHDSTGAFFVKNDKYEQKIKEKTEEKIEKQSLLDKIIEWVLTIILWTLAIFAMISMLIVATVKNSLEIFGIKS